MHLSYFGSAFFRALFFAWMILVCAVLVNSTGCDPAEMRRLIDADSTAATDSNHPVTPAGNSSVAGQTITANQAIVIGSFNIQTFGRSKIRKPHVVSVLVDIAKRFDVLAIQELRDIDQETIPEFVRAINRDGANYRACVSRRVGYVDRKSNSHYEEQMVYVYDANRIEVLGQSYVAEDRTGIMHRPPYVTHFRCLGLPASQAFSFVLMNVHVDPDDTVVEFTKMQDIIRGVFPNHPGEDDFILLGDLNDEASEFSKYSWLSNQFATIPSHWKTNTRMSKSYDNIIFDTRRSAEFMNQGGVLNLMKEYGLSNSAALEVSDHMPVWAVFSTMEVDPTTVTQGPQVMR